MTKGCVAPFIGAGDFHLAVLIVCECRQAQSTLKFGSPIKPMVNLPRADSASLVKKCFSAGAQVYLNCWGNLVRRGGSRSGTLEEEEEEGVYSI